MQHTSRLADHPHYRWYVLAVAMVGVASTTFPITILSASLPEVARDLNTSDSTISWVIAAPLLAVAVATPLAGKLGDIGGHRRSFLIGFGTATALAFLTAFSWNVGALIGLRTLAQLTGAATGPASMAIVLTVFPRHERGKALGWWTATMALSPTIGVVAGGPLVEAVGWRSVFVIQAIPAAIAVALAIPLLPDTPRKEHAGLDLPGSILLGTGVAAGLVAINRGVVWGWGHPAIVIAIIASPLLLTAFVIVEGRVASPLLPPQLLRNHIAGAALGSTLLTQSAYMGTLVMAPFLLTRVFDIGTSGIALLLIPRPVAFSLFSWWGGRLDSQLGPRTIVVTGALITAVASLVTAIAATTHTLSLFLVGVGLAGVGHGYSRPSITATVSNLVDDTDLGIASGSVSTTAMIGASAGIAILVTAVGESRDPGRFALVYMVAAAISVAGAIIALRLGPRTAPAADPETSG